MIKASKTKSSGIKIFTRNKRAYYDYEVVDSVEAGIVLTGGEVKSVKAGSASIKESFVQADGGELWLWNAHIPKWHASSGIGYDPTRKRRLLLHRKEIDSLVGKAREKKMTLVPLKMYGVRGKVKVDVGLVRGKKQFEKRQREREQQLKKELHQERRAYMV